MHPVLIHLGAFSLSTYGVLVAAAYMIGILWLKTQIQDMPTMTEDRFWILIYSLFAGAILGGKLLFIAVNWGDFVAGRLRFFRDFRYGFVFFGGLLGSILAGAICQRFLRFPYWAIADYFGVALPLGHWLGRLGCLAAGCCYGKPTSLPWAVALGGDPASTTPPELWGVPLHPTQVYESAADLAIALGLMRWVLPKVKKGRLPSGSVFFAYVALYSIARFGIEFLRGDDRGWRFASLWISQWIALAGLAVGIAFLLRRRRRA